MTVAELLESKGITKEVIAGLPKDIVGHLEGYITSADSTLASATQKQTEAAEALRQAGLERKDIETYVNDYGTSLTKMSSVEATNKALVSYLKEMKTKGFEVPDALIAEVAPEKKPIVPGSPAEGQNAVDEKKILGQVGTFMEQWLDANNEHIRLFGTPIPDNSRSVAEEAGRARKPLGQFVAEKYNFDAKRKEKVAADAKAHDDAIRKEEREKVQREEAEKRGSNPNLRTGESSRAPYLPKIKSDDFHKSDGNQPYRDRMARVKERIHADVEAARGAA